MNIINKIFPITIDCTMGQSTIDIKFNTILWPNGLLEKLNLEQNITDPKLICYLSSLRHGNTLLKSESAGDMILSNNLVFNEQNHFDEITNTIKPWSELDKASCHKLEYDGDIPLQNFQLLYKNLYL